LVSDPSLANSIRLVAVHWSTLLLWSTDPRWFIKNVRHAVRHVATDTSRWVELIYSAKPVLFPTGTKQKVYDLAAVFAVSFAHQGLRRGCRMFLINGLRDRNPPESAPRRL
jgi:hypothetical protein